MRHRLIVIALSLSLSGCWSTPTAAPEGLVAAKETGIEGTWKLDLSDAEARRLAALTDLVAGRPLPTDPRRTGEDLAYLTWATNVLARAPTDPERTGLERFVRDAPLRRLVVGPDTLTVSGLDGSTTRAWRVVDKRPDPRHGEVWSLDLGATEEAEPAVVAFRDADHVSLGPTGTDVDAALATATRWVRVPAAASP